MLFEDIIIEAISKKKVVSFTYKDRFRVVEPHTFGVDSKRQMTLSAWQRSGGSGEGWRDFHIKKMSELKLTDEYFIEPREGYRRGDSTLEKIIAEV